MAAFALLARVARAKKRLYLMPIRETLDADIMKGDREIIALANAQLKTLIGD